MLRLFNMATILKKNISTLHHIFEKGVTLFKQKEDYDVHQEGTNWLLPIKHFLCRTCTHFWETLTISWKLQCMFKAGSFDYTQLNTWDVKIDCQQHWFLVASSWQYRYTDSFKYFDQHQVMSLIWKNVGNKCFCIDL